jgi:hypothetical protein
MIIERFIFEAPFFGPFGAWFFWFTAAVEGPSPSFASKAASLVLLSRSRPEHPGGALCIALVGGL